MPKPAGRHWIFPRTTRLRLTDLHRQPAFQAGTQRIFHCRRVRPDGERPTSVGVLTQGHPQQGFLDRPHGWCMQECEPFQQYPKSRGESPLARFFPHPFPPRNRCRSWLTTLQNSPHRHLRQHKGPVNDVMIPEERPPGPGGPPFKSWSTMLNVATSNSASRGGSLGGETELKASGLDPCCWKVRVTTNSPDEVWNTS